MEQFKPTPESNGTPIENTNFVFDPIAPRYDRCNSLFSMGLHHRWRKALVRSLAPGPADVILDLCCGTGDMVFSFLKHSPARHFTAADLSETMLHLALEKQIFLSSKKWMQNADIKWCLANACETSLESESYDIVSCAFGIRNISNRSGSLSEIYRLLKPSGRLGVLEFSLPSNRLLSAVYRIYLNRLMPFAGRLLFGDRKPLAYLSDSIARWHHGVNLAEELADAGFGYINKQPLYLGVVTLWLARKTAP